MRSLGSCALLAGLLLSSPLVAQQNQAEGASASEVEALAQAAFAQAQKGEYSEAIALYLKAHQLRPTATLLYNVAAIYDRRLHDKELAVEYYTKFLKSTDGEPELIEKANRRLIELRTEPSEAEKPGATAAAEEPATGKPLREPEPRESTTGTRTDGSAEATSDWKNTAGWVFVVSGAAVAGVGLGFGGLALRDKQTSDDECTSRGCTEAGLDQIDRGQKYALISTIGVAAGAALAVGGFVFWGLSSKDEAQAQLTISPQPGGAAATLRGAF